MNATLSSTPGTTEPFFTRARWGAIFAGVFIAIAIQLLFTLIGVSVGMATIDPTENGDYTGSFAISAGLLTLIGVAAAMFCGGWVAGRMAGVPWSLDAMMHGAVVWALTAIISFYLMTTAIGSLVSAAGGVVGSALRETVKGVGTVVSAAGSAIGSAAEAVPEDAVPTSAVQQRAQDFLNDLGITRGTVQEFLQKSQERLGTAAERAAVNPDQAYAAAESALTDIYQRGADVLSPHFSNSLRKLRNSDPNASLRSLWRIVMPRSVSTQRREFCFYLY